MKRLTIRHTLITAGAALSIFLLYGAVTGTSTNQIGVEIPSSSVFTQNIHLFSNGNAGFSLLSTNGKTTKIVFLNNEGETGDEFPATLDYAYNSAEIQNGEIYLYGTPKLDPASVTFGTNVTRYPLGKTDQYFDACRCLGGIKSSSQQGLTADSNGYIYALNDASKNVFSVFSFNDAQALATISSTYADLTSICVSPDSYLYTTYTSGKQVGIINVKNSIPKNELKLFPSDIPAIPYHFLNSTTVLDANGSLFQVQGSPPVFHKIKDIASSGTAACALSDGTILCKTGSRTAGEFSSDGNLISEYKLDGDLLDLAANGTVNAAIVSQGSTLRFVDLSKPTTNGEDEASSTAGESSQAGSSSSQPASTPSDSSIADSSSEPLNIPSGADPNDPTSSGDSQTPTSIQSTAYPIDRSAGLLYAGASTTFAQLKSGIAANKSALRAVKPNGDLIESGNIGTGTVIELYADNKVIDRLVVLVKGDLTGSGSITSRDERLLYAHLNNGDLLSGVYLQAADMDGSNTVDTADLLQLKKLVSAN